MEFDIKTYKKTRYKNIASIIAVAVLFLLLLFSFWQIHSLENKYEKALRYQNEYIDSRISEIDRKFDSVSGLTAKAVDSLKLRASDPVRISRRRTIKKLKNETKKDVFRAVTHDSLYRFLAK